ncbi:MAG TPA: phage major capsid protein, partial [Sphingomicrobium sp.]|nr:phage major capsid protein [Sphingomicrobium sp.]
FARAEGAAYVGGTGVNQPLGFLSSPTATTVDGTRPTGALQTVGTGVSAAFPASNPADKLIDLVQTLRSPYRQGAVFVMNSATAAAVRKFKTADGAFMFQPSLAAGQPATLLGYPLIEAEDMPDISAGSLSIAFGNFKAGYVIAERNATTILRDPYTHKPYVHFYATKRVDLVVAAAVEEEPLAAPPANPVIGATYIVASGATGAWAGNDLALAGYMDGGWRFVAPREGMLAYVVSGSVWAAFRAGSWEIGAVRGESLMIGGQQVVGARAGAIGSPAGGSTVDAEARGAIGQILSALRTHGLIGS